MRAARTSKSPRLSARIQEDDDAPSPSRPRASLQELALEILAQESADAPSQSGPQLAEGTVIAAHRGRVEVWASGERRTLTLPKHLARNQRSQIAPGDQVLFDGDQAASVLPRRTYLMRPDPSGEGARIIVANVDSIVHVVSVVAPPLHPRIIDRVWSATQVGGAAYVLVVNKIELPGAEGELEQLEPYRGLGFPIVPVSTFSGEGIEELRARLSGQTVALVGHSGVGKSSVLNALAGEKLMDTGELMEGYGRGAHTTVSSHLWHLAEGTRIIDTPGVRAFGLVDSDPETVRLAFPEFAAFACRFRDCRHLTEPGCGVWQAVEEGQLSAIRYETYRRLLEGTN